MSTRGLTRREWLVARGFQRPASQPAVREMPPLPPRGELVNVLEFEEAAKLALDSTAYTALAGSDREPFDRMTLRPRMFVDSAPLSLTIELFGDTFFGPMLVGPVAELRRFHADGELALVRGAAAAKSAVVVSSRSSVPIEQIAQTAAQVTTPFWYQVYIERDIEMVRTQIQRAVKAGCRAVCLTVGTEPTGPATAVRTGARPDWRAIDDIRKGVTVPVVLKGVMTATDARAAVDRDLQGLVVSNGGAAGTRPAPIEALAQVADAVGGRVPVLVDGSFRRGSDVIKALALGARAVLLGRPAIWGLAAYGADGVQSVLRLLQGELARTMVNVGKPTIAMLDRSLVKIHSRATS